MGGERQHYLPAALIGGFGEPITNGSLRLAKVAIRTKSNGQVVPALVRAQDVGFEYGTYNLANPPDGVDESIIDKLWNTFEGVLPAVIGRLENRLSLPGDDNTLSDYVAASMVRHPATFKQLAKETQERKGLPAPVGDDLQVIRVAVLIDQISIVRTWRWRVLHSSLWGRRFMITDRGWMKIGVSEYPGYVGHTVFLPLAPRLGILGYLDAPSLPPRSEPFSEHLVLRDNWIEWINATAWADPLISLLISHPEDRPLLGNLPNHRLLNLDSQSPFRGGSSKGLLD